MNLEKFLFKKISLWILILTIILSIICIIWFGSLVLKSKTAFKIAQIPQDFATIFAGKNEEGLSIAGNRFNDAKGLSIFSTITDAQHKYLLLSKYDGDLKRSVVELIDLRKKKIIHIWKPNINKIISQSKIPRDVVNLKRDSNLRRYQIVHPLLLKNGDLIIHGLATPLTKIDMCSKEVWSLDYVFHHSTEQGNNSYWIPIIFFPSSVHHGLDETFGVKTKKFHDDGIMQVSNNGEVLFKKSIIQMFIDNNLAGLIYGGREPTYDPIHLNDIQPVLSDGKYFKKGDVFLSLRNLSMIVLYRPDENKIIWHKQFPWIQQHDVDILNDHQISIYNNKRLIHSFEKSDKKNNNILIYDFINHEVSSPYETLFKDYDIREKFEGLMEIGNDGSIFIEQSVSGRAMQFDNKGNLIWEYINRAKNNNLYRLNWSRIIRNIDDDFLTKLKKLNCDYN